MCCYKHRADLKVLNAGVAGSVSLERTSGRSLLLPNHQQMQQPVRHLVQMDQLLQYSLMLGASQHQPPHPHPHTHLRQVIRATSGSSSPVCASRQPSVAAAVALPAALPLLQAKQSRKEKTWQHPQQLLQQPQMKLHQSSQKLRLHLHRQPHLHPPCLRLR